VCRAIRAVQRSALSSAMVSTIENRRSELCQRRSVTLS
jgi:hypothetical protein